MDFINPVYYESFSGKDGRCTCLASLNNLAYSHGNLWLSTIGSSLNMVVAPGENKGNGIIALGAGLC